MPEKSNFSKAKEPNEDKFKVKKRQLFHPVLSKRHFQCSSNALPLQGSVLQPSPGRGAERESEQSPLYEMYLSRTQTNHEMNKALEPKDERIFGISNPKP